MAAELQAAVQLAPFSNRVIRLCSEDEATVAPLLETMAGEWGGEIAIGSYPVGVDSWTVGVWLSGLQFTVAVAPSGCRSFLRLLNKPLNKERQHNSCQWSVSLAKLNPSRQPPLSFFYTHCICSRCCRLSWAAVFTHCIRPPLLP